MRDYKKIKVWQLSDKLVEEIYIVTRDFPSDERFGLTNQMRRAAVSVPTNVCEGASRQHKRDYLNFLYVSRGSLMELEYLVSLSHRLKYLTGESLKRIQCGIGEIQTKLFGLIRSVESEI